MPLSFSHIGSDVVLLAVGLLSLTQLAKYFYQKIHH